MIFLLAVLLAFQTFADEGSPAPVPPGREQDGLKGAVRRVVEVAGESRNVDKSYDERGNVVAEGSRLGGYVMTRRYTPESDGAFLMCYQAWSMINSMPPPLAPRPVSRQGCGEAYTIRLEYKIKFERVNGAVVKAGSSLEEKAMAGQELAWRTKYFYDARGRVVEALGFNVLQAEVQRHVYTYAGDGSAPATYEYQVDGRTVLKEWYEHSFDGKGNWIERRVVKREAVGMSGLPDVIKRTVTYY